MLQYNNKENTITIILENPIIDIPDAVNELRENLDDYLKNILGEDVFDSLPIDDYNKIAGVIFKRCLMEVLEKEE